MIKKPKKILTAQVYSKKETRMKANQNIFKSSLMQFRNICSKMS